MLIDFDGLDPKLRYKLMCGAVIPRPVAWITTQGRDGTVNAAPYSFFNIFGEDPALVVVGLGHKANEPKDTTRNILETGEFVVNIPSLSQIDDMVDSAAVYPAHRGEPDVLDLALAPSAKVAPPRLADCPVALECRKITGLTFGPTRELLIGEAVALQARDGLVDPETLRFDWQGDFPIARLFADRYGRIEEIEPRPIPKPKPE
ncbi:flavin reductase family protein [Albimonas sp. CAU 1670]|uniref:flavin reductase family protein n=1 Tax=Albimonas sp. CAU 1670 TaxID=3032599 RepID=UPI0023DA0C20|nr:flavin reductase family protein [Albimonas sp. CAU 1670]MDF2234739.1 flavin reductase family protein [Albimonas sp. CAU 1670]